MLLSGAVGGAYRLINGAVTRAWLALAGVSLVAAIVVAVLVVLGTRA